MIVATKALEGQPVELVKLRALMDLTTGSPDVSVGLIDGPVEIGHPDLAGGRIRQIPGLDCAACGPSTRTACLHGTGVAGILHARRTSRAVAICPDCTLLVRAIFSDQSAVGAQVPSATPAQLAESIVDVIDAGARILNLSVALVGSTASGGGELEEALNHAARRGVIVAAAAGNQARVSGSTITRHPWVIPVVACDRRGRPTGESNIGLAIGRRGLSAPGTHVATLGVEGATQTFHGTSAAAPFVSGTAALLWSLFPTASATDIRSALVGSSAGARRAIVPPLLDASAAYGRLRAVHGWN